MSSPFGQELIRLRSERGLSLAQLARLVPCHRGYLSQLEHGARQPSTEFAARLDDVLGANGCLTPLVALPTAANTVPPLTGGSWRQVDADALAAALIGNPPTEDNALRLAHEWLVTEPPQRYELIGGGRRIGGDLVDQVEQRVHQIRLLDDHIGGRDSHAVATAELAATADLLRNASYSESTGRRLLAAVGELSQIAGWVASDAGRHAEAYRLYVAGARAAHAAGDTSGAASNLSSLAYQIANVGNPRDAVLLARSAYRGAERAATGAARALLLERVAWAHARSGEADAAERALDQVDAAYADRKPEIEPVWTYWLNPEEIEVMAGRVWTQLQRPLRAVPTLEHAISRYPDGSAREVALYLTWLAESLIQGGEIDRAAETALRALSLSRQVGSARAAGRVEEVRSMLEPHRGQSAVDAFLLDVQPHP